MADIMIQSVTITPNPVAAGEQVLLSVHIADVVYGILTSDGKYLATSDGKAIQRTTGVAEVPILTSDDRQILDADGNPILARKIR